MILRCNPVYSTWQPFGQALLVDSPLLLYIDVRHVHFLSLFLIVGEAWDLGPKYTTTEDLAPVRDESAEWVSQSRTAHIPIKELAAAESVNSSKAESDPGEDEMVIKRALTIGRFVYASLLTVKTSG